MSQIYTFNTFAKIQGIQILSLWKRLNSFSFSLKLHVLVCFSMYFTLRIQNILTLGQTFTDLSGSYQVQLEDLSGSCQVQFTDISGSYQVQFTDISGSYQVQFTDISGFYQVQFTDISGSYQVQFTDISGYWYTIQIGKHLTLFTITHFVKDSELAVFGVGGSSRNRTGHWSTGCTQINLQYYRLQVCQLFNFLICSILYF